MSMIKTKIRTRILLTFSVMLLFSFGLIGITFNIALSGYIQDSAVSQLEKSYERLVTEQSDISITGQSPEIPDELKEFFRFTTRGNTFRIEANIFIVDSGGNQIDGPEYSAETIEIIETIQNRELRLTDLQNHRLITDNFVYYISAHTVDGTAGETVGETVGETAGEIVGEESIYWVIYADVTGLTSFAATINRFLLGLVFVTLITVGFVTLFLSKSITSPIKNLNMLATRIGQGDFTPNDFKFKDMEFENLNMTLNKTAKQLGIYDSEQKTFFQNVSHELRTPLMSIKCYAEGIAVGLMEPKKASDTILQETDRLTEMVKNLLYISRIDNVTSSYVKMRMDLLGIIRICTEKQSAIADAKHIHFVFDFNEPQIFCDCVDELITRAIDNIISNAIRYAASEIILSCRKKGNQIILRISDDGPGIETESMPHIFERFYKGSDGNHGIGLSLTKSIVEQHNGRITAENSERGGAVFTITLPGSQR